MGPRVPGQHLGAEGHADFIDNMSFAFGPEWRLKAPEALGVSMSTVDRYIHGHTPIPMATKLAAELLAKQEHARQRQRQSERAYKKRRRAR